jgi:hypothetical protein
MTNQKKTESDSQVLAKNKKRKKNQRISKKKAKRKGSKSQTVSLL